MEEILEKYKELWLQSIDTKKTLGSAGSSRKFITLSRTRLLEENVTELEEFLWNEFKCTNENLYYLHLRLAEFCLTSWFNELSHKEACVLFLNRTFENWIRRNRPSSRNLKNDDVKENSQNNVLALETYHILKAFDLAVLNLNLLGSFNKIYKFDENFAMLRVKIDELAQKTDGLNLVKIVSELKVNHLYPIDYAPIIIPLMVADKYKQIDELVNNNEKTLYSVVEVCDKICAENVNFKRLAESYECKKPNKFSGSQVAKFALTCLKKVKKPYLIHTVYIGIQFQLRLNQLRFLINSAFNSTDPMSFHAWSELVIDLVGNDERLIYQLFFEIVHFNKNINLGLYFADKYGLEYIRRLPPQTQFFFEQNAVLLKEKYMQNIEITWSSASSDDFYFPEELTDNNIIFIDDRARFENMLEFFAAKNPDIVGLDCEWKPMFGPEDTDLSNEEMALALNTNGDKNQRANLLQIATREYTFVVEVRDLVDVLDKEHLDKFGELVLFKDDLIKLGYNFEQDANRLCHSFWKFNHRFCEFTASVINMDEVASDVQRRYKLFVDEANTSSEQGATSAASASASASTSTLASTNSLTGKSTTNNQKSNVKPKGLSKLTQQCLGKPLDKRECMSNWQNRPLRRDQLRYAALDAFVLIKIHDLFVEKFKELGLEFEYTSSHRRNFY